MLKRLKKKFVFIVMGSLLSVLLLMILSINIISYINVKKYSNELLDILIENDGAFNSFSEFKPSSPFDFRIEFSKETPYETRFFSIKNYGTDYQLVNTNKIASVSNEQALFFAQEAYEKGKTSGQIDSYIYKISEEKNLIVFIDCSRQLNTFETFRNAFILTAVIVSIAVFALIIIFSSIVVKPFIDNYSKQKSFITDASHELKTPLAIISANNELIEMEYGESETTQSITKQVERMNGMVKNLTTLARLNENNTSEAFTSFSLTDMAYDLTNLFDPIFKASNKELTSDIQENINIKANEKLIRQLITLLIENASKYSITYAKLSLIKQGSSINISIENDACNLENGNLKKIFERFYRSDDARASGIEGSGIGLAIAKEICDLHKATINANGLNNIFTIKVVLPTK